MTPKINPQFAALIPPLSKVESDQLEANILRDGCRDPLVAWLQLPPSDPEERDECWCKKPKWVRKMFQASGNDEPELHWQCDTCGNWEFEDIGILVDGHHRLEICTRLKIPYEVAKIEFSDENAALIWIIRNQFGRRNITLAARCQLAEKLAAALKPQAKENQQAGGGDRKSKNRKSGSSILTEPTDSREQAAKEAGVSVGSMAAYKLVKSEGTAAEVTLVLSDPNTKLHRVAKDIKDRKVKLQYETRVQTSAAKKHEVPSGPFDLILADPPWEYDFAEAGNRKIENQYDTQSLDQICANTPPNTAHSCVLLLWATAPKLLEALRVMDAWGFAYKTSAVWDKEILGMGYWFRGQHELLLVGIKGKVSPPSPGARVSSVFREARSKHSAKPECVFNWIEKAFPDAKKLERYARTARPGWACEGNEL